MQFDELDVRTSQLKIVGVRLEQKRNKSFRSADNKLV